MEKKDVKKGSSEKIFFKNYQEITKYGSNIKNYTYNPQFRQLMSS